MTPLERDLMASIELTKGLRAVDKLTREELHERIGWAK